MTLYDQAPKKKFRLKEWYHVIIAIDDHQINAYLKKKDGTLDDLLSTRVNRDPKMARGGVLITPKGGQIAFNGFSLDPLSPFKLNEKQPRAPAEDNPKNTPEIPKGEDDSKDDLRDHSDSIDSDS